MAHHDPTTNTGFPDPTEDEEGLVDLIGSQIHSFVSQLHQQGKLRPEQISQRLWDLVDAVKNIAQQYADDYHPHSPSSSEYPRDDGIANHLPLAHHPPAIRMIGDLGLLSPI
jgi:hypothetical protein